MPIIQLNRPFLFLCALLLTSAACLGEAIVMNCERFQGVITNCIPFGPVLPIDESDNSRITNIDVIANVLVSSSIVTTENEVSKSVDEFIQKVTSSPVADDEKTAPREDRPVGIPPSYTEYAVSSNGSWFLVTIIKREGEIFISRLRPATGKGEIKVFSIQTEVPSYSTKDPEFLKLWNSLKG